MIVSIAKGIPSGTTNFPPSKSYAHRYLIGGMLSKSSQIDHIEYSEDISATLDCLSALGTSLEKSPSSVLFSGIRPISQELVLPCRESGSTLRFLLPLGCLFSSSFSLTGAKRLLERGVAPYEVCLSPHGIQIQNHGDRISVQGRLTHGVFHLDGTTSSQYLTGLLFALPLLPGDSEIRILGNRASSHYTSMTLQTLKDFHIQIQETETGYRVPGNQRYEGGRFLVEADASNAAFLSAFQALGAPLSLPSISPKSLQGDRIFASLFQTLKAGFAEIDVDSCIDLAPILFAFASLCHGGRFTGIERLAIKESSRAEAMKEELAKAGVAMELTPHCAVVHPFEKTEGKLSFSSHNDHRIAMALSLFSLTNDIEISGSEAVKKSYPNYFQELARLGMEVKEHE